MGKGADGKPVFMESDIVYHPEVVDYMNKAFGRSAIKDWYDKPNRNELEHLAKIGFKSLDVAQMFTKQAMFSLSPFHFVQEGTHAVGHKVDPFGLFKKLPDLKADDPDIVRAQDHGLMMWGDPSHIMQYEEGMFSGPMMYKIPFAGRFLKTSNEALFNSYIPKLKYATYRDALARNIDRFKTGADTDGNPTFEKNITKDDIEALTARQVNYAYGHLNYAAMGADPTMQHVYRLALLAPDFLFARLGFTAQAAKGLTGSKIGREQIMAMGLLAGGFFMAARIGNKLDHDDYNWDQPFGVVHDGHVYTMRSVPEDIFRMFSDSGKFASGRISPIISRGLVEGLTERGYFGQKLTKAQILKDMATAPIPLSLKTMPWLRELTTTGTLDTRTVGQSAISSLGLQISPEHVDKQTPAKPVKFNPAPSRHKHRTPFG
jgi:hypothetical protein